MANAEKENQKHHIELLILNEKLQQQALDHERKIKRLMTLIFIIVFLAVVISSSLVLLGFRIRKKKDEALLKQTATELRSRLMEINMKAINFQLNPHFIFNCVDTVESLLRESRTDESMTCLRRFSGLTRMILESMSKKEIPLDQEIEIIKSYMELEKVRVGTSFSYTIETDPAVNGQATMVPPLILQPFVENSIKHGFVNRERPYMIRIQIGLKSGMLSCQIEDNGMGVSAVRRVKNIRVQERIRGLIDGDVKDSGNRKTGKFIFFTYLGCTTCQEGPLWIDVFVSYIL